MNQKSKPVIPREHGAWALLYAPFVVGVAVSRRLDIPVLFLLVAVTALFLAHAPLSMLLRLGSKGASPEKRRTWKKWLAGDLAIATAAGAILVFGFHFWYLLALAAAVAPLLILHLILVVKRQDRSLFGELLGVLGLTSTAAAAYYVSSGRFDSSALLLWLLNVAYFTGGVFYVKMKISRFARKKEATRHTRQCLLYHLLLLPAIATLVWWNWIPPLATLAFAPIIVRGFIGGVLPDSRRLNLKSLGYSAVALTIVFVLVLSLSLHLD